MYNDDFEKNNMANGGEDNNGEMNVRENTAPQASAADGGENCAEQARDVRESADSAEEQSAQSAAAQNGTYYAEFSDADSDKVSTPAEDYAGGVRYTKGSPDSGVTNGYEWNSNAAKRTKTAKAHRSKKSGVSGFKIFTGAVLTVFALSFVAMTAMVASYIHGGKSDTILQNGSVPSDKASVGSSSYTSVTDMPSGNGNTLTIPQIAAKCSPSAVGIVVEVENTNAYNFGFGFYPSQGTSKAIGSGFILNSDGYIITNHHVIEDANKITVILSDKTELEATLVGSDSISDIAVIKVEPKDGVTLVPAEIGNSDELVVGEEVVAIGCPAGIEYMGTVTNGIVSAINRDVEITDSYGRVQKTMTLIQTNATINKGNSGGPLINSKGQVIGINTLKLTSEYEGIGFSIPINGAMAIINQLIDYGEVVERTEEDFAYGSGMIGISGSAVTAAEAKEYGIPQGVLVFQIDKNSSAAKAGLRRGDIITKYNGTEVKTVADINNLKAKNRAGEEVTVTVYRDAEDSASGEGQTLDITFKLDAQN